MKLSYDTICALAHGIDYTEKENGNVIFSRFSKQERECLSYGKDNSFSTSGVRLEFETDCTYLKISVCNEHSNPHGRNFYSYDIYCNDNMIGQIKNYNVEPSYPYKEYSLDDRHKIFKFPVGIKKICVYFPWSVKGMIKEIEINDGAIIKHIIKAKKMIMYGDSITQGYDSKCPSLSYASKLADMLNANAINKGIGGSVFMPMLTKIKNDFPPDLITVAYGTNDWNCSDFNSFNLRCESFFENLLKNYPQTPIFLIAPVWRADGGEQRKFGDFSQMAQKYRELSDMHKNIHFINGFDFIPHNKKYYRDGYLHPNDKGFEFYAKELAEYFKKISIIN